LPASNAAASGGSTGDQLAAKQKTVLVVSLHGEYSEKLRNLYQKNSSTTGSTEAVGLYQRSGGGEQHHNQKALAEMVLLSFSDAVVSTAVSTFGYVGRGLAGLRPWVLM
jgi:xyloglucan fucosyltransferase